MKTLWILSVTLFPTQKPLLLSVSLDFISLTLLGTLDAKLKWNNIFGHKMMEFYEATSGSSNEALFALFYKFVFRIFRILGTFSAPSWVRSVASLEDSKSPGCLSKQKHRRGEHPECANMKRQLSLFCLFVAPCYEPILPKQTRPYHLVNCVLHETEDFKMQDC